MHSFLESKIGTFEQVPEQKDRNGMSNRSSEELCSRIELEDLASTPALDKQGFF